MRGLLVLSFVPFLVAVGFFLRVRAEQRARRAAEQRVKELESATDQLAWLPLLAHELRSPVAAVLGYQELLEEGTFGPLEPSAADAVRRIGIAGGQIISVIDGLERLGGDVADFNEEPAQLDARTLIQEVVDGVREDAEARGVTLTVADGTAPLRTRPGEAARALRLALAAAIKSAPAQLRITAEDADTPLIRISGSRLDPQRDNARTTADAADSGAALRLLLARHALRTCGGDITLVPDSAATTIRLSLPRL